MSKFVYKPTFSPYMSYFTAKNKKEALSKLQKMFSEYPKAIVKTWLLIRN